MNFVMIQILDKKECTGCGACSQICPKQCIEMKEDEEGFKYPVVNKKKCINCDLCKKVCPIISKQEKKLQNRKKPTVIAAWSKENFTRLDSTSGGIFSEIANYFFEQKGFVCGAIYDKDWTVKHILTNKEKDLEKLRSSKYLQSEVWHIYKEIQEKLLKGDNVLICAAPCQIKGLYNFLNKDYENLITCDFICRGVNSPKVFIKYIKSLENKYNSKVVKIKFKNKTYGWHNFATKIDFENGKSYLGTRYFDSYMVGYLKYNAFMRPSCYNCQFKELPRVADITLADFWGIEKIDSKLDNNQGTSLVLLNNEKGEKIFNLLKDKIVYKKIESDKVFEENVCMNNSVEMTNERIKVFENIDKMTYDELSKNFFPEPNKIQRIFINTKIRLKPLYQKILKR